MQPRTANVAILVFPAGAERPLAKALRLGAPAVVLDLEDAVGPELKDTARASLEGALATIPRTVTVGVRVNGLDTPWGEPDLIAIAGLARQPSYVVVPKVDSAHDLTVAATILGGERSPALHALIETAGGLLRVADVAAHRACAGLVVGYADLAVSLGRPWPVVDDPAAWASAQDAVVLAARAHGVAAVDGPLLALDDDEAVHAAAACAHRRGFDAKWAIHPSQLEPIERAFAPGEPELRWARDVVRAARAEEAGGATRAGAQMVDEPVVAAAEALLGRAGEGP